MRFKLRVFFTIVGLAAWQIGRAGLPFIVTSDSEGDDMSLLEQFDNWAFRGGSSYSPTLMVIGLAIIFSVWVGVPLFRHFVERLFGEKRREFSAQFRLNRHTPCHFNNYGCGL